MRITRQLLFLSTIVGCLQSIFSQKREGGVKGGEAAEKVEKVDKREESASVDSALWESVQMPQYSYFEG